MRKQTLHLDGERFGDLDVIGNGTKPRYWMVRSLCCGKTFEARGSRLAKGEVRCPCQKKKHGHTAGGRLTPTYQSWKAMKARCRNKKIPSHGGAGIRFDPRWESFDCFLADMGERPEGKTLDRKNPWGDYCRENCEWADTLTQARHKRNTRLLRYDWTLGTPDGGTLASVAEWARYLRHLTGNHRWTSRKLDAVLQLIPSLNEIVRGVSPYLGFAPEEIGLQSGPEFHEMWEEYMKTVYLQAA